MDNLDLQGNPVVLEGFGPEEEVDNPVEVPGYFGVADCCLVTAGHPDIQDNQGNRDNSGSE